MRTTSTRALETILNVLPIEIQIKSETAMTAMRLKMMGEWHQMGNRSNHQRIIEVTIGETADLGVLHDRIPEETLATECEILIPERQSWSNGTVMEAPYGNNCYTDGAKMGDRSGLVVYLEDSGTEISFRLPDHTTILQAEIRAITECVRWLSTNTRPLSVNVLTDSQMAIRAIASNTVKSRTVLEFKNIINSYSVYGSIRIIWVPVHCGVDGNEHVNDLAIKAREAEEVNLDNPKPFGATRSELKVWAKRAHVELWNSGIIGRTTKIIWGDPD
ncbi:uncharacterized protein LOC142232680 [Haematobia irritans]|uniref:uncharacterized protein LOC142232680 n=1 Tax=Haematobia irritans TaxID=7368 RepID=UPI003F5000CB